MSEPILLKPKKIFIRSYYGVSHASMLKLIRTWKQKKFGLLEAAYDVEEIGKDKYNVRMEYTVK